MNNFITIKTFSYGHEAVILKGALENEGIECFIKDEFITQVNPLYSQAVGGVKLQVREGDIPQALEILKENGYRPDEDNHALKLHLQVKALMEITKNNWFWITVISSIVIIIWLVNIN